MHFLKRLWRWGLRGILFGIFALLTDFGKRLLEDRIVGGTNHLLDQHGGRIRSLGVEVIRYLISKPLAITALVGILVIAFAVGEEIYVRQQNSPHEVDESISSSLDLIRKPAPIAFGMFCVLWLVIIGFAIHSGPNTTTEKAPIPQSVVGPNPPAVDLPKSDPLSPVSSSLAHSKIRRHRPSTIDTSKPFAQLPPQTHRSVTITAVRPDFWDARKIAEWQSVQDEYTRTHPEDRENGSKARSDWINKEILVIDPEFFIRPAMSATHSSQSGGIVTGSDHVVIKNNNIGPGYPGSAGIINNGYDQINSNNTIYVNPTPPASSPK